MIDKPHSSPSRSHKRPPVGDVIVLVLVITGMVLITVQTYAMRSAEPILIIRVDSIEWQYTLDEDRTLMIPGPLGQTEVVVSDGAVHVHDSPCRAKVCVAAGEINRVGEWIICLPNHVFLSIEGVMKEQSDVDAVVY